MAIVTGLQDILFSMYIFATVKKCKMYFFVCHLYHNVIEYLHFKSLYLMSHEAAIEAAEQNHGKLSRA